MGAAVPSETPSVPIAASSPGHTEPNEGFPQSRGCTRRLCGAPCRARLGAEGLPRSSAPWVSDPTQRAEHRAECGSTELSCAPRPGHTHTRTLNLVMLSPKFIPNQNPEKTTLWFWKGDLNLSVAKPLLEGRENSTLGAWEERGRWYGITSGVSGTGLCAGLSPRPSAAPRVPAEHPHARPLPPRLHGAHQWEGAGRQTALLIGRRRRIYYRAAAAVAG